MHSSYQRQEKSMLIKLDMEDAFDRVRISFLYKSLRLFGFKSTFVILIKACTDKSWIAPFVNEKLTNFFQETRDIQHGFLLLLFLYILMTDTLSTKLSVEKEDGIILGIKMKREVDSINHSLPADDSLLLGGASLRMERTLKKFYKNFVLFWELLLTIETTQCMVGTPITE